MAVPFSLMLSSKLWDHPWLFSHCSSATLLPCPSRFTPNTLPAQYLYPSFLFNPNPIVAWMTTAFQLAALSSLWVLHNLFFNNNSDSFYCIYLRGLGGGGRSTVGGKVETERNKLPSTLQYLTFLQWSGLQQASWNLTQVFHMGVKDLTSWIINCCLRVHISMRMELRAGWSWNSGTIWYVVALSDILTAKSLFL